MHKLLAAKPRIQYSSNGLKVFTLSMSDFSKLKELLKKRNIEFYTHALKNEKPIHQVIKGLPLLEDYENIISSQISDKGLKCIRVLLMKQKSQDNPMYLIIYHIKIRWEKYRHRSGVSQCHRCQECGHGSNS